MTAGTREFFLGLYTYSGVLNVLTCTAIIPLVLFKNRRSRVVQAFCIFIAVCGFWSLFYTIWMQNPQRELAEFWVRTVMMTVAVMPASFLHFVSEIAELRIPRWFHAVNYLTGTAFATTVYHPLFASYGGKPFFIFPVWPIAGPIFYLHFVHFTSNFCYGWVTLYRIMRVGSDPLKTRIVPVFWGTLIGVVTGCNNYLPWFKIYLPPLFPVNVSLIVLFFAYAIIRHQLMGIEIVIKRTLVFAGLVGSVVGVVSVVAFVSQDVLARVVEIPKWLANVLAAAIIAGLYGPLRNWLTNVTDRYLFQKRYDYKALLRKFTDEAMVIMNLKQLVRRTVETLTETIKLEHCTLLLFNKDTRQYEVIASRGTKGPPVALDEREPFITFLRETQEPIGTEGALGRVRFPEDVSERVRQLKARLCLPLHLHDDLIGVLCLGKKKSDEEYTQDDLDILLPLSRTLGIAVSNAQLFEELARTQAEAAQREKLAVIGTLSAGINHEIRNPLGIVKMQCETFVLDWQDGLLKGKPWEEILDRCLAIMQGAIYYIDQATSITRKLSSFAKPIREVQLQPVSIAAELDEVLVLVGHDLKLDKIEVKKDIQAGVPPIRADRGQIQEILFNLIRNAGQAITPPGTIWILAAPDGASRVRIEITDTGHGIPPETLGKIFDPFFTTKEPGKGTGLGLFIVRQIVERNKGRITVASAVGKGTTFFLDFPVADEAHAVAANK